MEQNYITVWRGGTFEALFSRDFIEFSCSYGLPSLGASNRFSLKTRLDNNRIPIRSFVQLNRSNWMGKIMQIDINFKDRTVLYTGVSIYEWMNHFIPVRTPESILVLSLNQLLPYTDEATAMRGAQAIVDKYSGKWATEGIFARLNRLCELAGFPLELAADNTTYGEIEDPYDSDWQRKYDSYMFRGEWANSVNPDDPPSSSGEDITYYSTGEIHADWEGYTPPSGVIPYLDVDVDLNYINLTNKTPILELLESAIKDDSYVSVEIHDKVVFRVHNRFYDKNEDIIILDKLSSPTYYHEYSPPNTMAFTSGLFAGPCLIVYDRSGYISNEIAATNDTDFADLSYSNRYGGGDLYFIPPVEDSTGFEGRWQLFEAVENAKDEWSHSIEIFDAEDEFFINKKYNLYSHEARINDEVLLTEKIMTAVPNGHKITYNFKKEKSTNYP